MTKIAQLLLLTPCLLLDILVNASLAHSRTNTEINAKNTEQRFEFKQGVIIPHWMGDLVSTFDVHGGDWFNEEDVQWIAKQGFDHLRIKVDSYLLNDKSGDFDTKKLQPLHNVLAWAKTYQLGVVVTVTSVPGYRDFPRTIRPEPNAPTPFNNADKMQQAKLFWNKLAKQLASYNNILRFEILNNPRLDDQSVLDHFQSEMLAVIRKSNPNRMVYQTTLNSDINTIKTFKFPKNDPNVALAINYWGPYVFSFQWNQKLPLVSFPGIVPDMTAFTEEKDPVRELSNTALTISKLIQPIEALASWSKENATGREIYISSFGVYKRADDRSTSTFIETMQTAFEDNGFNWAIYDYASGCWMRDDDGNPTAALKALAL